MSCVLDRYTGAIDCIRQTLTRRGVAGLYCGQAIMCVREPAAFGVYFGCYDAVKRYVRTSGLPLNRLRAESLSMPRLQWTLCGHGSR